MTGSSSSPIAASQLLENGFSHESALWFSDITLVS
jgi:hypothetical protein